MSRFNLVLFFNVISSVWRISIVQANPDKYTFRSNAATLSAEAMTHLVL